MERVFQTFEWDGMPRPRRDRNGGPRGSRRRTNPGRSIAAATALVTDLRGPVPSFDLHSRRRAHRLSRHRLIPARRPSSAPRGRRWCRKPSRRFHRRATGSFRCSTVRRGRRTRGRSPSWTPARRGRKGHWEPLPGIRRRCSKAGPRRRRPRHRFRRRTTTNHGCTSGYPPRSRRRRSTATQSPRRPRHSRRSRSAHRRRPRRRGNRKR
jgi:hypothetical protein